MSSDLSVPAIEQLLQYLQQGLAQAQFERLVLSKYKGEVADLERITIRAVELKQQAMLSFVYRYKTRDITKNYDLAEGIQRIAQEIEQGFQHATLRLLADEYQLMLSKKGKAVIHHQAIQVVEANATTHQHDRDKQRFVDVTSQFLHALKVTDKQATVIPAMARKWKQINKFVEIFSGAVQQAGLDQQASLHVVDFGSGKGYLTFAVHDYVTKQLNKTALVTGVELRDELVKLCNQASQQCDMTGLDFFQGDVRSFQPANVDVMIALHACDIATDYALHTGIRLGASVIMCAPCCHKQIRPQLHMPQVLKPMLQYGVHLGQEAEMLTDSLRALLLEAHGYETKVFEFVALEHTSKNKMILAVKKAKSAAKRQEILDQIAQIKQFYGIQEHCLETLLAG